MSQTAIGKAALVLSVNQAGWRTGLAGAKGDARKWADDVGRGMSSRMGAVGRSSGAAAAGGMMAGLSAAGPAVVAAAAVAIPAVVGVRAAMQELDTVARGGAAAKAFGLTAEQFTGMAGVAASVGEQQREFIESLVTLGKVSAEGAAGKGEVAAAWFKSLNLNAAEFNRLPIDEKFFQVWEALQKVEDPAERVRALMVAFGEDGGKYLLPLLSKTPDQVRAMAAGFQVSTAQVERATTANTAMIAASSTLSRAWRGVAVGIAPLIEAGSNGLAKLQPAFDWAGRTVAGAVEWAGRASGAVGELGDRVGTWLAPAIERVGRAWEVVKYVGAAVWDEAVKGAGFIVEAIGGVIDQVGGWMSELFSLEGVVLSVEQVTFIFLRTAAEGVGYLWDSFKVGVGVTGYVFSFVVDGFGHLINSSKQFVKDLLGVAGLLPDELGGGVFRRLSGQVDGWAGGIHKAAEDMRQFGANALDSWGESAEQAGAWMDDLEKRMARGPQAAAAAAADGAVAARVAATAVTKALKHENAALLKGSSAEVSVRLRHEFGGGNPQQQMLEQQRLANAHLGAIKAGIGEMVDRAGTVALGAV